MRRFLSIVVLVVLSYFGMAIIFAAFSALDGVEFSALDFFFDDKSHIFWMISLLFFVWVIKFAVGIIIYISEAISPSKTGRRYLVLGITIVAVVSLALVGNLMTAESRSLSIVATYIATIAYGGLFVYCSRKNRYK